MKKLFLGWFLGSSCSAAPALARRAPSHDRWLGGTGRFCGGPSGGVTSGEAAEAIKLRRRLLNRYGHPYRWSTPNKPLGFAIFCSTAARTERLF